MSEELQERADELREQLRQRREESSSQDDGFLSDIVDDMVDVIDVDSLSDFASEALDSLSDVASAALEALSSIDLDL